jgi:hypothetical protein
LAPIGARKEEGQMAGIVYEVGNQVLPRKYIEERWTELAGKTGIVRELQDDGGIVVDWKDAGERTMRPSHIKLDRTEAGKEGTSVESTSSDSSVDSDESPAGTASAQNDRTDGTSQSPVNSPAGTQTENLSSRQRLVRHLCDPSDPKFGGGDGHDHGSSRSESAVKSASKDQLEAWHHLGHPEAPEDGPDHP